MTICPILSNIFSNLRTNGLTKWMCLVDKPHLFSIAILSAVKKGTISTQKTWAYKKQRG